jgi:hypothetical protein
VWRVRGKTGNGHGNAEKILRIVQERFFQARSGKAGSRELRGTGEEENRREKSVNICLLLNKNLTGNVILLSQIILLPGFGDQQTHHRQAWLYLAGTRLQIPGAPVTVALIRQVPVNGSEPETGTILMACKQLIYNSQ